MRFGIDLGGTKAELIALEDCGAEKYRQRVATPSGDYEQTVRTLARLVKRAESDLNVSSLETLPTVGIGIPGTFSLTTRLVKNANSTCLIGQPLDQDLQRAIGRPVRIANDADCFTFSESVDGAGQESSIVFGVILGTGVGGGLVINKNIIRGPNAITGEWGHNPLPWPEDDELPGLPCYCGNKGCIETFLSGPGLINNLSNNQGHVADAEELSRAAANGDQIATLELERYAGRLAKALASVINIIDPDLIVLGGGLSKMESLYKNVPDLWSNFIFSDTVSTRLSPPQHGDASGARGAAWLWPVS